VEILALNDRPLKTRLERYKRSLSRSALKR
jgi:hypothetical protein